MKRKELKTELKKESEAFSFPEVSSQALKGFEAREGENTQNAVVNLRKPRKAWAFALSTVLAASLALGVFFLVKNHNDQTEAENFTYEKMTYTAKEQQLTSQAVLSGCLLAQQEESVSSLETNLSRLLPLVEIGFYLEGSKLTKTSTSEGYDLLISGTLLGGEKVEKSLNIKEKTSASWEGESSIFGQTCLFSCQEGEGDDDFSASFQASGKKIAGKEGKKDPSIFNLGDNSGDIQIALGKRKGNDAVWLTFDYQKEDYVFLFMKNEDGSASGVYKKGKNSHKALSFSAASSAYQVSFAGEKVFKANRRTPSF